MRTVEDTWLGRWVIKGPMCPVWFCDRLSNGLLHYTQIGWLEVPALVIGVSEDQNYLELRLNNLTVWARVTDVQLYRLDDIPLSKWLDTYVTTKTRAGVGCRKKPWNGKLSSSEYSIPGPIFIGIGHIKQVLLVEGSFNISLSGAKPNVIKQPYYQLKVSTSNGSGWVGAGSVLPIGQIDSRPENRDENNRKSQ